MVKSIVFIILGLLAFGISFAMFIIGSTNSHLTELKPFSIFPIPLGIIFLIIGIVLLIQNISSVNKASTRY